ANLVFDIDDGNAPIVQQALTPASSCAAAPVASPTVSAPGGAVTNGSAANDATTVQYSFSFTGAPKYFRVYVDTDASASTGFAAGGGVGAEYLIEGSGVYRSAGAGWNWTSVGNATFSSSGGTATWSVARALLGETAACGETSTLLFQIEDAAGTMTSATALPQAFTNASSCTATGTGGSTPPPPPAGTGGTTPTPTPTATGGTTATPTPTPTPTPTTPTPTPTATGGTTATPTPTPTGTGGTSGTPAAAHTQVV